MNNNEQDSLKLRLDMKRLSEKLDSVQPGKEIHIIKKPI